MTDPIITTGGADTWVNSLRTSQNYGDANAVHVKAGERRGLVRPPLPNILGRTVTAAVLYGRVGTVAGLVAQTLTHRMLTGHWTQMRATWANQPGVNAASGGATALGAVPLGGLVALDVTADLQAVADGTATYHGWRIETDSTAAGQRFRSVQSGDPAWELHVTLASDADEATNLRPDGGGAVGTGEPVLAWDFPDQATYRVQVDTPVLGVAPDEVAPDYDTAQLTGVAPQFDLSGVAARSATVSTTTSSTTVTAAVATFDARDVGAGISGAGIPAEATVTAVASATSATISIAATATASGVAATISRSYTPPVGTDPTFWRVLVTDVDGNASDWSPWAEFTVATLPALIVDAPTGVVGDPAVTVLAHLSTGTVSSWEVWATGPDRSDVRWRSGVQAGPTVSVQVPRVNRDGRRIFTEAAGGWIYLRVADSVDRAVAVGQQTYTETWIQVVFAPNGAIIAPTNLTVVQAADGDPRLTWQWNITDVPESFNIMVDGETVAQVAADDLTPIAGRYTWRDGGEVPPMRQHTLGVAAVADNGASNPATYTMTHELGEIWLIPDADIEPIWFTGTPPQGGFGRSDRAATYVPVVGPPVDVLYDWEGFSGVFGGVVNTRQDVWAALDRIEALRTSRNRTARLVWGSQSILVRVRNIYATSSSRMRADNLEHDVQFDFVQLDD